VGERRDQKTWWKRHMKEVVWSRRRCAGHDLLCRVERLREHRERGEKQAEVMSRYRVKRDTTE